MDTLDGQPIPRPPGSVVYAERLTARYQGIDCLHYPPVVTSEWVPGRVLADGTTALFDTLDRDGKPRLMHLRQCRVYKNAIAI